MPAFHSILLCLMYILFTPPSNPQGLRYGNGSPPRNGGYSSFEPGGGAGGYSGGASGQHHVSASQVLGSEDALVDDITTPGGLRPVPDAADLRRFVEAASTMDGLRLAELLRAKLEGSSASWHVPLRALCALEAVLQRGSTQACGEVAVMFQSEPTPIQALATHSQPQVRDAAGRCLRLLLGADAVPDVTAAAAAAAPAAAKKAASWPAAPAADLLSLDTSRHPQQQQQARQLQHPLRSICSLIWQARPRRRQPQRRLQLVQPLSWATPACFLACRWAWPAHPRRRRLPLLWTTCLAACPCPPALQRRPPQRQWHPWQRRRRLRLMTCSLVSVGQPRQRPLRSLSRSRRRRMAAGCINQQYSSSRCSSSSTPPCRCSRWARCPWAVLVSGPSLPPWHPAQDTPHPAAGAACSAACQAATAAAAAVLMGPRWVQHSSRGAAVSPKTILLSTLCWTSSARSDPPIAAPLL